REPRVQELAVPVPFRHALHRVPERAQPAFHLAPRIAQCGHAAHAGDDDALHASPPFTPITSRVMYAASSDIRNATSAAPSPGVPTRCIGISFSISSSGASSSMSVATGPGATQFTVISRDASSTASALAAPISPALAAL